MKSLAQHFQVDTQALPNGKRSVLVTALIYTRVSSEDQAREGVSLDAQLAECRRYAARQGWALGDEYQDIMTGSREDRPRYRQLLIDIRRLRAEGRRAVVVVAALDRFGRKLLESLRCREELKGLGVTVHAVREGGEVSDLVANMLGAAAQEEVARLGRRVREVREHFVAGGWWPIGRPAWGYRLRTATTEERTMGAPKMVLAVDPETAPYVREAFDRVATRESVRNVARWIVALPEAARGGRVFPHKVVRRLLSAPVYVARAEARDADGKPDYSDVLARPVGRWPALIDDEVYRRVQEQIGGHRHMPKQASGRFLLSGLLRCPSCGWRMTGSTIPGARRRYRCSSWNKGTRAATVTCNWVAPSEKLDRPVMAEVEALLDPVLSADPTVRRAVERAWEQLRRPSADAVAEQGRIRGLEREADKARQRLTRAAVLFADGEIDRHGYELLRDKARSDLEAAEAELARLGESLAETPSLPPLEDVLRDIGGWADVLANGDVDGRRAVLAPLIEHVVPERTDRNWREWNYAVNITWTPMGEALRETARLLLAEPAA
jgi:site-specific DNA recombinase